VELTVARLAATLHRGYDPCGEEPVLDMQAA